MGSLTGIQRNIWGRPGSSHFYRSDKPEQGETQAEVTGCEVADEPVVVRKFRPVKPGNSVEDKTGMTADLVQRRHEHARVCEGVKLIIIAEQYSGTRLTGHELRDGAGSDASVSGETPLMPSTVWRSTRGQARRLPIRASTRAPLVEVVAGQACTGWRTAQDKECAFTTPFTTNCSRPKR